MTDQTTPTLDANGFWNSTGLAWVYTWNPSTLIANPIPDAPSMVFSGMGLGHQQTTIKPPTAPEGSVTVWDIDKADWDIIEDHIGTKLYSTTTANPMTIEKLGPLPDGYTTEVPPVLTYGQTLSWTGTAWQVNPMSNAAQAWQTWLLARTVEVDLHLRGQQFTPDAVKYFINLCAVFNEPGTWPYVDPMIGASRVVPMPSQKEDDTALPTPPYPLDKLHDQGSEWYTQPAK